MKALVVVLDSQGIQLQSGTEWLSGPELARLQRQFEEEFLPGADLEHYRNFQNHEQGVAIHEAFLKQVNCLFETWVIPS